MDRFEASMIGVKAKYTEDIDYLVACFEEQEDDDENMKNCIIQFTNGKCDGEKSLPICMSREHTARIVELLKKFISEFDEEIKDL